MSDILQKICNTTRIHVEQRKAHTPLAEIKVAADKAPAVRGFLKSLKNTHENGELPALIAEVKKASPSKGIIREDFNPAEIAKAYKTGGASALSVLTDMAFFQGHDDFLIEARQSVDLPALRKDFMVDLYQIYESRALGADCILVIVAALNDEQMGDFYSCAQDLGMDVLVEIHNQAELDRALKISPDMIGVNSRNLKTLEVDTQVTHDLLKNIPDSCFKVAESGIFTHDDIVALQASGAHGFLVGESLMRQDDITLATKTLLRTK